MDDFSQPKDFGVPVDSEHKSKVLRIWSFQRPHHLSFHLNWISFFIAFFATFAAPPLVPVIRNDLDLTKSDLGGAAIASVTGAIFARILTGVLIDSFGPRYGHGFLQLLTSSATFGMALVTDSTGFIICRMVIGFSLATFVCCQFWCSIMFNVKIVGTANATGAGWGNLGGGVTQLIMPFLFEGLENVQPTFIAWRCAFLIPASAQILIGICIMSFGQDLPDGNYAELVASGQKDKAKAHMEFLAAVKNYRTWIMVLNYGYCFGVELTVNNNISPYLFDQFNIDLGLAGTLGACFGLMNIFARSLGGIASDITVKRFGMRGRLWTYWFTQTMGGVFCLVMFYTKDSLGATMAVIIVFSLFVQMAEGAAYGIVPFITRRGLGTASGFIGAGGNAGSAVTQAIFFTSGDFSTAEGWKWMGVMVICITTTVALVHFPMWGSMFFQGNPEKTEDEYYAQDYTEEEKKLGLHKAVSKFANESRSQRGFKAMVEAHLDKDAQNVVI